MSEFEEELDLSAEAIAARKSMDNARARNKVDAKTREGRARTSAPMFATKARAKVSAQQQQKVETWRKLQARQAQARALLDEVNEKVEQARQEVVQQLDLPADTATKEALKGRIETTTDDFGSIHVLAPTPQSLQL